MVYEIFSKKVTGSELENRLIIPTGSLEHFHFRRGENTRVLNVKDKQGKEWCFHLIIRNGDYAKPVLSKGWRKFVKDNNLEEGFEVTFYKEDDEVTGEVKYTVEVKKPYIVFGAELGYVSHGV